MRGDRSSRRSTRPRASVWAGRRADLPGRGNPLFPPFVIDTQSTAGMTGRVTFPVSHIGGNAAAHGGAIPLLFDDVLGFAAAYENPDWARTAYLHVNYRNVTPIGVELQFSVTVDRIEGRKRFVTGRLMNGDVLCCDAEALFVTLLTGAALTLLQHVPSADSPSARRASAQSRSEQVLTGPPGQLDQGGAGAPRRTRPTGR